MKLRPPEVLRAEALAQHEAILQAARAFARRVADEHGASAVYLFGSRARSDWRRDSDTDLMVVAESFAGMGRHERSVALRRLWEGGGGCDVLGFTESEFEESRVAGGIVAMALDGGALMLWPEERPVQITWRRSQSQKR